MSQNFQAICTQVEDGTRGLAIPGASLGVIYDDTEETMGFGVSSMESRRTVTANTPFQIGSITKTCVALAIMRLSATGLLDLDAAVRTYLPSLHLANAEAAKVVSVRHLLTHTGGWAGDFPKDFGFDDDALSLLVADLHTLPQLVPPGATWSYSNTGYCLAGRVIEIVAGKTFEQAMQELVLDPLGMKASFVLSRDALSLDVAVGHLSVEGRAVVASPWSMGRAMNPAGGLLCNMRELLAYARFMMGDGGHVLPPGDLAAMQSPQCASTGFWMMGLGWHVLDIGDVRMISHGGTTMGQVALLRIVPSRRFAVAVLANSNTAGHLCMEAANEAIRLYMDLTMPQYSPITLPVDVLSSYTGVYQSTMESYEVAAKGEHLCVRSGDGEITEMAFSERDKFFVPRGSMKDAPGEFLRRFDGQIGWMRFAGRLYPRVG